MNQLIAYYSEVEGARTALPALVYFARMSEQSAKVAARIIQAALRSRDSTQVSYAAIALTKWMDLPESGPSAEFKNLISTVIAIIESGRPVGLQQLISFAKELLNGERLSEEQRGKLVEIVSVVFEASNYSNIDPSSPEAVSASTIRAEMRRIGASAPAKISERHRIEGTGRQIAIRSSSGGAICAELSPIKITPRPPDLPPKKVCEVRSEATVGKETISFLEWTGPHNELRSMPCFM